MSKVERRKSSLKDASFGVRMPRSEVNLLDEKARASGISRNELLRRCAFENVVLVDIREMRQVIDDLLIINRECKKRGDRLAGLVEKAQEQNRGRNKNDPLLEEIAKERRDAEETMRLTRMLAKKAARLLSAILSGRENKTPASR